MVRGSNTDKNTRTTTTNTTTNTTGAGRKDCHENFKAEVQHRKNFSSCRSYMKHEGYNTWYPWQLVRAIASAVVRSVRAARSRLLSSRTC